MGQVRSEHDVHRGRFFRGGCRHHALALARIWRTVVTVNRHRLSGVTSARPSQRAAVIKTSTVRFPLSDLPWDGPLCCGNLPFELQADAYSLTRCQPTANAVPSSTNIPTPRALILPSTRQITSKNVPVCINSRSYSSEIYHRRRNSERYKFP